MADGIDIFSFLSEELLSSDMIALEFEEDQNRQTLRFGGTKEFKDKDWDNYRNHRVGFIFQSYNLIMHQTVLSNVEIALTLSGVSKQERRKRAKEVLKKVLILQI